ncbi:MAG: prepilin-type N-terminal cleavage/methylation domain-containing protein [Halanaerobiales bacterium]|nr:prepilin-type N-terminal cleavage/methylation domain-containing protein [Halanaerobiales bacterium]
MKPDLKSQSGFTFIEIIVAVSILSIISLTLYSMLNIGLGLWEHLDQNQWSHNDLQLIINRIGKDLRSTFFRSSTPDKYFFKGNMYQVEFFSREYETGNIRNVSYEFSPYDETLFLIVEEERIPLITQLERCNFYFYNSDFNYWDNYWDGKIQKKSPSMMRIEFAFKDVEEEYRFDFPIYIGQKGIGVK